MGWTTPKTYSTLVKLTAAELNTYQRDNLNFLKSNIAWGSASELTISSGAITVAQSHHRVDTESDAASDDLDTINGGSEGQVIAIRAEHADRTVVLKDGTGNLDLGGDVYLTDTDQYVVLIYDGTSWQPVAVPNITHTILANTFQYPDTTAWVPTITGAYLPASKTGEKVWLPLSLNIGDQIVSYKLVGDVVETTAATLDCKLVRVNKADPLTTTDVAGGSITQVDSDGNFDAEATLTAVEVAATDKQYLLEIQGTTDTGDALYVIGAEVKVIRLVNRG